MKHAILFALSCGSAFVAFSHPEPPPSHAQTAPATTARVNRTVPNVKPPKTSLEFSPNPSTQEIFRARVFEEPLVPIGGEPSAEENADLATALLGYAKRTGPDDFSSLTGFLEKYPHSSWRTALLTCLGLDYYNTAYYSRALAAWEEAWLLGQQARDPKGKFLADRAVCELAGLYSRLGRMNELEALLKSVERRVFIGGASERINMAREAFSLMQHKPEVSFCCGPLALQCILKSDEGLFTMSPTNALMEIRNSASTQKGFSLPQVAELSKKVGLDYQMAFRGPLTRPSDIDGEREGVRGDFIVPSVVHWKVGHYAALVRQEGDRYLIEDPTFGNTVWATSEALKVETSGYFLIPPGDLPPGWRSVDTKEGASVWGKGTTTGNDPDQYTCSSEQTTSCGGAGCTGMALSSVHLMLANLQIRDTPVGYTPPVGPPVQFTVRYNHRDYLQPASGAASMFGPKWTHDWNASIKDNPSSPLADVKYQVGGGGVRTFTHFDVNTQTFSPQQYDQMLLKRIGGAYDMSFPDGSKYIFAQPDGSIGASRQIFLSQVVDPQGNAVTLTYDASLRLVALTDAIGQVTTLTYGVPANPGADMPADPDKLTKVTDPFGRFATFHYTPMTVDWDFTLITNCPTPVITSGPTRVWWLQKITDVLGLASEFTYLNTNYLFICASCPTNPGSTKCITNYYSVDFIDSLNTPYGTTTFVAAQGGGPVGTTRSLETTFPDGSHDRVEYNQAVAVPIEPPHSVPAGLSTPNDGFIASRNTFYWSRIACATGYGDYSKAKIYHWLHSAENGFVTGGILESTKEAFENRVWYNYPGQTDAAFIGKSSRPTKVGRVLDDGTTQLYSHGYNSFGNLTNSIDPVGRTFSLAYATNGIDLVEVRQTRAGNDELLFRATYNAQHRPLAVVDAAGQTNTFTYNARGQRLTATNSKGETTTFTYGVDGQLFTVDGPLPGAADSVNFLYDALYRVRAITDVSGYRVTVEYDDMDRLTRITHPDTTFEQFAYNRLDQAVVQDRAGRQKLYQYDSMRQVKKQTDPLGRVTLFDWCRCGSLKGLTDPLGRTTTWLTDVRGRPTAKQYADGSQVTYQYENTISRLRLLIDEKQQVTQFTWNRDDTLASLAYFNAEVPTPGVSFTYDPDYARVTSMTDGTGLTRYSYNPITGTPTLGAGALASLDGPLPNDTITYAYDELGGPVHRSINGVGSAMTFDAAGRLVGVTNALGAFAYAFEGSSRRMVTKAYPNGQTSELSYGNTNQDLLFERITHKMGATPISEFLYGHDVAAGRIATWSQQAGALSPSLHAFGYDAVNQLLSGTVTNAGNLVSTLAYSYDPAANRLTEQVGASNYTASYNALNEISSTTAPGITRTNEWDALDRLVAVNVGNQRTEFTYDGMSRRVAIRQLVNGFEVSHRRFVWCGGQICEERDAAGTVTKKFFTQGMKVESGPTAGNYYYTRDHLGSIRELTDSGGNVRARYAYDPYGRRTKLSGDMEADFGFAGMFYSSEANLALTYFRAYDPEFGRWLSRDPLPGAEKSQGPNLYAYVGNDPVNQIDPLGLVSIAKCLTPAGFILCAQAGIIAVQQKGREAVQFVGQGFQRLSSAIGNCFSRAPSAPPPAAPQMVQTVNSLPPVAQPVVQQVVQSLPGLNTHIRPFLDTLPQNPALQNTMMSLETETAQFVNLFNRTGAWDWFHRMNQASQGARSFLPTVEAQMEDIGLLFKMQELLFFYSGQ